MKNFIKLLLLLAAGLLCFNMTACSNVPAGYKGVKVYLLGKSKGVDHEVLSTGRYWIGMNEELYLFPVFTQNRVWTASKTEGSPIDESISFQTVEGLVVGTDIGISYHISPDKVSAVFEKYRKGIDEITTVYLRNMVRDGFVNVAGTMPVEEVYGKGKAALLSGVEEYVRKQVVPIGIIIDRIYLVGDMRLPREVIVAINTKIAATQKAQARQNEVAEASANADKAEAKARGEANSILKVASAQAEANRILARSLTPELIQYRFAERWDGVLPKVTGGATPLLNLSGLADPNTDKK